LNPELRDATTGRVNGVFLGHTSWIIAEDLSRDGRFLLTASADGTAKLWSVATQELLWSVPAGVFTPQSSVYSSVALDEHATRAYVSGVVYDLSPDLRTAGEIGAMIAAKVPYQIVEGQLSARPDPGR
jgi:WD40 repeat protein